jgi:hypothetical protein
MRTYAVAAEMAKRPRAPTFVSEIELINGTGDDALP